MDQENSHSTPPSDSEVTVSYPLIKKIVSDGQRFDVTIYGEKAVLTNFYTYTPYHSVVYNRILKSASFSTLEESLLYIRTTFPDIEADPPEDVSCVKIVRRDDMEEYNADGKYIRFFCIYTTIILWERYPLQEQINPHWLGKKWLDISVRDHMRRPNPKIIPEWTRGFVDPNSLDD